MTFPIRFLSAAGRTVIGTGKTGKRQLYEWTDELVAAVEAAKNIPRKVGSMYLLPNSRGQRYTSKGFQTNWYYLIREALDKELLIERGSPSTIIRAKAGNDGQDEKLLGHSDPSMLNRVYKRNAVKVTPVKTKIFDS